MTVRGMTGEVMAGQAVTGEAVTGEAMLGQAVGGAGRGGDRRGGAGGACTSEGGAGGRGRCIGAPSLSQISWNLEVISVRLNPGWRMPTGMLSFLSSSDMRTAAMLQAARLMW